MTKTYGYVRGEQARKEGFKRMVTDDKKFMSKIYGKIRYIPHNERMKLQDDWYKGWDGLEG